MTAADDETLVPAGKVRCYIHDGRLWPDTPEEHVRQRVARSLVEEYGYDRDCIELEFPIKMGSGKKKRVDIAVFPDGAEHEQHKLIVIVEAKRPEVKPSDREEGIEQLKSYLAASLGAQWGLWVGSEMRAFRKELDPKRATKDPFPETTDIPLHGDVQPKRLVFGDLVPATEGLRDVFRRCHDYIHVNGNLGKEKAFFELLKLIFSKVHDEHTSSGPLEFGLTEDERTSELGQRKLKTRLTKLFDSVKKDYPYIFPNKTEEIELDNRSLAYCVAELQKYSLVQTSSDIKGEAYEEIVGVTSRREHGAFFTPRNVCDVAIRIVFATYEPADRLNLNILDPACGTGGFLRAALLALKDDIVFTEQAKWGKNREKAGEQIRARLRKQCDRHLYGIDKLAELVRAAQMNLAMHGDGSSNVYNVNSLLAVGEWPVHVRSSIKMGSFDVVFTNPPFGSKLPIDDPHILQQFQLSTFECKSPRSSMPPEHLFVERCWDFLKPGGRMAIVLPQSILSNPGLEWIRHWVLLNAWILASITLPRETFAKSDTHTLTSVLVLQKFTEEERRRAAKNAMPDYPIFMAIAEKVGWDLRGQPVFLRTDEGEEILHPSIKTLLGRDKKGQLVEYQRLVRQPIIDDQMPAIGELFAEWLVRTEVPWA